MWNNKLVMLQNILRRFRREKTNDSGAAECHVDDDVTHKLSIFGHRFWLTKIFILLCKSSGEKEIYVALNERKKKVFA